MIASTWAWRRCTLLGLTLLASRLHWIWSFLVLALAINFKVVPIILVPVWAAASLPLASLVHPPGRLPRAALGLFFLRCACLVLLAALCLLPFYLSSGEACLGFLAYHKDRGIEVQSLYSTWLLATRRSDANVHVYFGYGGWNTAAPMAPLPGPAGALAHERSAVICLGVVCTPSPRTGPKR